MADKLFTAKWMWLLEITIYTFAANVQVIVFSFLSYCIVSSMLVDNYSINNQSWIAVYSDTAADFLYTNCTFFELQDFAVFTFPSKLLPAVEIWI